MTDQNDDFKLFREQMRDVTPLRKSGRVTPASNSRLKKSANHNKSAARERAQAQLPEHSADYLSSVDYIDAVKPHQTLCFMRSGLQHNTFKKLKQGKLLPETDLDLHGYTVEQARVILLDFVQSCIDEYIRVVVITHGHGEYRERPALLKSCVNHWLKEIDDVLAFHTAQPKHGGSGATYVLLRQSKTGGSDFDD